MEKLNSELVMNNESSCFFENRIQFVHMLILIKNILLEYYFLLFFLCLLYFISMHCEYIVQKGL